MRIRLLAVGTRQPRWVDEGFESYAKRLPHACRLDLTELRTVRRDRGLPAERAVAREGERLLAAIPSGSLVVALDERGKTFDTRALAARLADWLGGGRDATLMIGGPDGLAAECLARAELRWSLSPLTLPHGLVRVLVAEQLYRAWSLLHGHPYHRE